MKTILIGDIHLQQQIKYGRNLEHGISQRLYEQKQVLDNVLVFVKDYKPDRVLLGGDVFHSDSAISTEVLNTAYNFFYDLNKLTEVYCCRGNHDLSVKMNSKIVHYSVNPFLEKLTPPKDVFFGHYDIDFNPIDIKGMNIVLVHKTPLGCELNGYTFDEGVKWQTLSKQNSQVFFDSFIILSIGINTDSLFLL